MDYKGKAHGWWVRLRFAGVQKYFTDLSCGSKTASYKAAVEFRDKTIRKLKQQGIRIGRKPKGHHRQPTVNSKTGIVGIHVTEKVTPGGVLLKNYVATYYPGKYKHAVGSFSVNKYGNKRALKLAMAFRREGISNLAKQECNKQK